MQKRGPLQVPLGIAHLLLGRPEPGTPLRDLLRSEPALKLRQSGPRHRKLSYQLSAARIEFGPIEARQLLAGGDAVTLTSADRLDSASRLESELTLGRLHRPKSHELVSDLAVP
jgi:hypothetical protein